MSICLKCFLSKDFNLTTAKKKLSCGKTKEYKYNKRVKDLYIKGIIDEIEAKSYYKNIEKNKEIINIVSCIDSLI